MTFQLVSHTNNHGTGNIPPLPHPPSPHTHTLTMVMCTPGTVMSNSFSLQVISLNKSVFKFHKIEMFISHLIAVLIGVGRIISHAEEPFYQDQQRNREVVVKDGPFMLGVFQYRFDTMAGHMC